MAGQIDYSRLSTAVKALPRDLDGESLLKLVSNGLIDLWLEDYARRFPTNEIVTTNAGADLSTFLFDIAAERLIAAWAVSEGKSHEKRDKGRMSGAPIGAGEGYHRGHAIPHSMGGILDINLVPQLGSVNIGQFRVLERKAVNHPDCIYFTHWRYSFYASQLPASVQQGIIIAGEGLSVVDHQN